MKLRIWVSLASIVSFASCANPINQVTADNYQETCFVAEESGNLKVAEEACGRALTNVGWGNLGPAEQSQKQYNLARIKRKLAKFSEAEVLLKQSLEIEEKINPQSELRLGRRLVELSVSLAAQGKWQEGAPYLTRAYEVSNQFSLSEKKYIALILSKYAEEFRREGKAEDASKYDSMASKVGV